MLLLKTVQEVRLTQLKLSANGFHVPENTLKAS